MPGPFTLPPISAAALARLVRRERPPADDEAPVHRDELGELAWVSPDRPRMQLLNGGRNGYGLRQCTVSVWHGYVKKQFYAADASGAVIAESPLFSARGRDVERSPKAEHALGRLLADLAGKGWIETGEGPVWHERELMRLS
jgi:hypothetical protein